MSESQICARVEVIQLDGVRVTVTNDDRVIIEHSDPAMPFDSAGNIVSVPIDRLTLLRDILTVIAPPDLD